MIPGAVQAAGLPVPAPFVPFDNVLALPVTRVHKDGDSILVNTHELDKWTKDGWTADEIDRDSNKLDPKTDPKE